MAEKMLENEWLERLGIKRREIIFTKPVKVMIRYNDEWYDQTKENVTSIKVDQTPILTSIFVIYKTDRGEGSVGSSLENIKEIVIVNE